MGELGYDRYPPTNATQPHIRYYVVCLIDILGQKKHLQRWARLPTDGKTSDEFNEAIENTVGTVLRLSGMFEGFFSEFGQPPQQAVLDRLPLPQWEPFMRIRECGPLTTQQFSDTFVFYAPLTNSHGDLSGATFFQMLTAAASAVLYGLATKAPIRGAITVGAGMEIRPGNFYGPALAVVHSLESEVAEYPRVVLSEEAVRFAHRKSGFSHDDVIEHIIAAYHEKHIRPLLIEDTDQQVIVDFMGHEFHSGVSDKPVIVNYASRAYRFARAEAARFEADGSDKLAKRYSRLLDYMEPRLSLWGIAAEG
jgi:hypothetical protein